MKQQTAVLYLKEKYETLIKQLSSGRVTVFALKDFSYEIEQAKEIERQQIVDELIGFQIYLAERGKINNYDWDFEKEASKYMKSANHYQPCDNPTPKGSQ